MQSATNPSLSASWRPIQSNMGLMFFFSWVGANALSGALCSASVKISWGAIGVCIVPALVTSTMQWLVLRRLVVYAGWWWLASLFGFGLALVALAAVFGMGVGLWGEESWVTSILSCLAFGTVVGITQWLALRGQASRFGWWVLASIAGLSPAIIVFLLVTRGFDVGVTGAAAAGALGGVLYGSITGVALVWLLQRNFPESAWIST